MNRTMGSSNGLLRMEGIRNASAELDAMRGDPRRRRTNRRGTEVAVVFCVASFLVFGIVLIFGAGTTHLVDGIGSGLPSASSSVGAWPLLEGHANGNGVSNGVLNFSRLRIADGTVESDCGPVLSVPVEAIMVAD